MLYCLRFDVSGTLAGRLSRPEVAFAFFRKGADAMEAVLLPLLSILCGISLLVLIEVLRIGNRIRFLVSCYARLADRLERDAGSRANGFPLKKGCHGAHG